jgi:membrane-bound serine protease (ClpP class)
VYRPGSAPASFKTLMFGVARWANLLPAFPILLAMAICPPRHLDAQESESNDRPLVLCLRLENEAITPAVAQFLHRCMKQAQSEKAECLVIVLDTPGGLVESTREIVKEILTDPTCVVVFVAPSGARAASAGTFITLAAHVAAMAPGTTIGAAHPVQVGGLPITPGQPSSTPPQSPGDDEPASSDGPSSGKPSVFEEKIVNDTVAWVRSLAELRDRNAEWAATAVTESTAVTASEALKQRVIDLMADDLEDLLSKIDGREVRLDEKTVSLKTADSEVREIEMWWGEQLLATISNPNIAFLLLIFGFYGVLFEFYSPGWGVAGTTGLVCLLLSFYGLSVLPIDYLGLALIAIALALLVAEMFVPSHGALTVGGAVCLVLGGLMLVDSPAGFLRVSTGVVLAVASATAAIVLTLAVGIVRAHRSRVLTGAEGIVTETAIAKETFSRQGEGYWGTVLVHGELWRATSKEPVLFGQCLAIEGRDGLTLMVCGDGKPPGQTRSEGSSDS